MYPPELFRVFIELRPDSQCLVSRGTLTLMIGRHTMPQEWLDWNARWRAPFGGRMPAQRRLLHLPLIAGRLVSPFRFQPNSTTRRFEYPWAFYAADVRPGQQVLEIGGALSGFQFALASEGARVINVDPFLDYGPAHTYGITRQPRPEDMITKLNTVFRTSVELRRTTLRGANVASASVDTVFCISTLEHLQPADIDETINEVRRILRPGGKFVLTVDLFLDLIPFTDRASNDYGSNVNIKELVDKSAMELTDGDCSQLYGFEQFSSRDVQANLAEFLIGTYPVLAQALVLRKQ